MRSNKDSGPNPTNARGGGDPAAALPRRIPDEDEESAALIRRIRSALRADSRRAAAARLSLDAGVLRRILAGRRPTVDVLRRLCRVYGIDGHWLLTGEGTPAPNTRTADALRGVPSELLMAEFARRLAPALAPAEPPPIEAVLARSQAALDTMRRDLLQPP
ncbi:MAG TPA: helix-turn-helix domain-containing protein [Phycisphaerales bacterium]|nr:helix-turn-helix domain-containing protein [Phycisphaerales bacterium]